MSKEPFDDLMIACFILAVIFCYVALFVVVVFVLVGGIMLAAKAASWALWLVMLIPWGVR